MLPNPMEEPILYVALLFLFGGAALFLIAVLMWFRIHVRRCKKC